MKVLVARINKGEILVAQEVVSSCLKGLAVFVGIEKGDNKQTLELTAEKIINLRIFEDQNGKLAYSVKDKTYSILCVPNFTLCACTNKGNRPSFDNSLAYTEAEKIFDDFVLVLKSYGLTVDDGVFGAYMDIKLDLDGPVNIILDSKN